MSAETLLENARALSRMASETARYSLEEPAIRGGAPMTLLLLDCADLVACAATSLERGAIRQATWTAVDAMLGELIDACRAVGNDGQLARFATCGEALRQTWAETRVRLAETERQARRTTKPDTTEPAPEDPRLTEALRETFPASDPIAPG